MDWVMNVRLRVACFLLVVVPVVCAVVPGAARAAVAVNGLEDLSTSTLSDWTTVLTPTASRAGATITCTGGTLWYYRSDLGMDGPNAFMLEAVLSAEAMVMDGERGARMWVKFSDTGVMPGNVYWAEVRLVREMGVNKIKLYDANQGVALAALNVDWATGPIRVRIKRQRVAGTDYVLLQAEDAGTWDDPATPNYLNDPSRSLAVLLSSFFSFMGNSEVAFGNYVAGSYYSVWESVHWTTADDSVTVFPYWPPAPGAPTVTHQDQGTGNPQGVEVSEDFSVGYLSNDVVYSELDADGTTYLGDERVTGAVQVWSFVGLSDDQSASGRIVARDVSGRTTVGQGASVIIPDRQAPAVSSILRADASPTNAQSVGFVVTFTEDVMSVDPTDFELQWTNGGGTGSVTSVTPISASVYTVTASGLDAEGTLRLAFTASQSITDLASNALATPTVTGEEYVIDTIAPAVVSILRADPSPTRAQTLGFTVSFSQAVSVLATSDFVIVTTGTAVGSVLEVNPVTQQEYTVTVDSVAGDGTLRLDLVDLGTVTDAVGNPIGGAGAQDYTTGEAYTVDHTPPPAPSPTGTTPTNDPLPTWSWSAGSGGAGFFRFGFADNDWLQEDVAATSFQPSAALTEGSHTLYVQERDELGNWSPSGSFAIVVDQTPASVPIVTGDAQTTDTTPTWSWTSGGGGDGVYRFGWVEGTWIEEAVSDTSYTPSAPLIEDDHVLFVQERDEAGNWSDSGSFTIAVEPTGDATPDPDEPKKSSGCSVAGAVDSSLISLVSLIWLALLLMAFRRRLAF